MRDDARWCCGGGGCGGTITIGNVGAGGGGGCCVFLPVNILTVLCKKSVFCPAATKVDAVVVLPLAADADADDKVGFDVDDDDIEWHRNTIGALPADQSLPLLLLLLLDELDDARTPAELERFGGGHSDSNTVRFGGGLIHF